MAKKQLAPSGPIKSRWATAADLVDPPELRWRRDPVAWATERAGLELWSKQREILYSLRDNSNTAVKSCHSAGKGLALNTPLPTPTGWVLMRDVAVGDIVYDEDGRPTRITAVSEVRHLDCYRVTFTDSSSLITDGDHLWNVIPMSERRQARGLSRVTDWRDQWDWSKTLSTRELRDLVTEDAARGTPGVPVSRSLQTGDDVDLLIPPYVLGVWLGDGCAWNAGLANHPDDDEIRQRIESHGWTATRNEKRPIHVLLRPDPQTSMASLLRQYDLIKNKHIPNVYLRASYAQRLELLRGLMDTDGSVGNRVGGDARCGVGFKNELLARQTYELIRSLGWRASIKSRRAKLYDKDCGEFWIIAFTADEVPFRLTRKAQRWKPRNAKWTLNTVRSVEPVPTVPTRCITVDSPRGLYLAGESMTVTHNSFISAVATCWWIDVHPPGLARVITTAPTSAQVDAILWFEINRLHSKLGLRGQCNLREWYLGRQLIALGRKPPDHQGAAFQGLHAKYLLVIYDEAFGIPKKLWDEGSSLASNEYARQLAIGNPDGPGEFQEVCREGTSWNVVRVSFRHSPAYTGEKISPNLAENLISKRWVEERKKDWGEDSALFKSKCDGDFPDQGDPFSVIPHDWAMKCKYIEFAEDDEDVEAGIDVGAGGDRTVIRERRGLVAGRESVFLDSDPMKTVGRLAEKINEWGVKRVKIDSTGIGWGIAGRLRELSKRHNPASKDTTHSAEIVPINFGSGPSAGLEKKFLNRRAEIYWTIGRELSRLEGWDLSSVDDQVIHEMAASRYEILDSHGKIKIEKKDQVIKRLRVSPDRAEALLLAFYSKFKPARGLSSGASLLAQGNLLTGVSAGDRLASVY